MTTSSQWQEHGLLSQLYPSGGWRKWMFRAPLYLWRMGLGWLLPRQMLVLATTGRKSGLPRYVMVEHFVADGKIYIVSGWGERAQWVKNLEADSVVTVETMNTGVVRGTARRVTDEQTFRELWTTMQRSPMFDTQLQYWQIEPTLEDFLAKRDRAVIFGVDPGNVAAPPSLEQDLAWIPTMIAAMVLLRLLRGGSPKKKKRMNAKARRRKG